jgi:GT2 family glycosyltransferase
MDVVVVNYHTPADLERFLLSLASYPPSEPSTLTVIEVDGSDAEQPLAWKRGEGLQISVPGNIGYGRACNLGAARGHDDIVAFFNADIEITAGSLDRCLDAFRAHGDWGVLGPCQIDRRNRIRHAGIFGAMATPMHRGWNEIYRGQYRDVRDAVSVSGSAYFVKRKVWAELTDCPIYREIFPDAQGAFLPTPHYYEETWASYHAQAHGYRVVYFGPATLIHKWHQASPVGGWADQQMPLSRSIFRRACDAHGIDHD